MPTSKKVELLRERLKSPLTLLAFDVAFSGNNKIDSICNIRDEEQMKRGLALLTLAVFFDNLRSRAGSAYALDTR